MIPSLKRSSLTCACSIRRVAALNHPKRLVAGISCRVATVWIRKQNVAVRSLTRAACHFMLAARTTRDTCHNARYRWATTCETHSCHCVVYIAFTPLHGTISER